MNPTIDVTAIILAGGRGTRSLDPNRPKFLQEVCGFTLFEYHVDQLERSAIKQVVLSLGFKSEEIIEFIPKLDSSLRNTIIPVTEQVQLGTIDAIKVCKNSLNTKYTLILLGDILINCDYNHLINYWLQNSKARVCAIVHPNLHPNSSDRLIESINGSTPSFLEKNHEANIDQEALAMAGVFIVETSFLLDFLELSEPGDISQELIKYAIKRDEVYVLNSSFFFADTGTPERLSRATIAIENKSVQHRGKTKKGAIFIDRDGTLLPDLPLGRDFVSPSELEESTAKALAHANRMGVPVFVVTNQPAIAKGFMSEMDVYRTHLRLQEELRLFNAYIDEFIFCPHHPDAGFPGELIELKIECNCRKPKSGMFHELAARHSLELSKCFVIGDTFRDTSAADAINAMKILVKHGDHSVANAILASVESIRANH